MGKESFKAQMLPGHFSGRIHERPVIDPVTHPDHSFLPENPPKNANIYKSAAEPGVLKTRHLTTSASWKNETLDGIH